MAPINHFDINAELERELEYLALQARWTRPMRLDLYRRAGLMRREKIADIGCADGLITAEIAGRTRGKVVGIDISVEAIARAREKYLEIEPESDKIDFKVGDFQNLPFRRGELDAVTTNFTLMWVERPERAVKEAARVLKKGGVFLATGEPDYGGRIDLPEELSLKDFWADSIRKKGGDPFFGRRLVSLFRSAGFKEIEAGVHPSFWTGEGGDKGDLNIYLDDLGWWLSAAGRDPGPIIKRERAAIKNGLRLVFMPIFWATGVK
ncbi:MAG: class I SAM-dependent methyltransferase [Deltaproteobacteria bacterium]|uniref:Class I SAM-dependent methyltransferase n=1 Tax=Candidatus Zymogenus saltonus TaxID=2844893 RepID=A0A9D8KD57_9DELT|nr:class I SAM-dependent methyltransferase [Candidatus Zymogenus saltonus]